MPKLPAKSGLTANHWGIGIATVRDGRIENVGAHSEDPDPSLINDNIAAGLSGKARVLKPAIRKGWLENGPGPSGDSRGREPFVEVSWDRALDLLAGDLNRVCEVYGNGSIFGGSYGWGSAGRFHHPQSQLKRFLNTIGGFVSSKGNYSYNAALVLMPHIVGDFRDHVNRATRFSMIARHGQLVVSFGGLARRAFQVTDGGITQHRATDELKACRDAGVKFVNISPLRSDIDAPLDAEWLPPRPGTDVAVMMGLAHTLLIEGLHDTAFLDRYTVGFEALEAYILGQTDGVAKDAIWAAEQSGVSADRIKSLAREMAGTRTMITCAAGLQRADWGEQPLWMCVALAAMIGQIGLPGGGYTIGYAANGSTGITERLFRPGVLPQGKNPISDYIPVAMSADMLLHPGETYQYNGADLTFPDIRLMWWAGGNPFHHHQDLNRLHRAFQCPETNVVNEINWTQTARHADIVLPVAAPEERRDFVSGRRDNYLLPTPQIVPPPEHVKTEFEIFSALSKRLGTDAQFTEGKSEEDWLNELWETTRSTAKKHGITEDDLGQIIAYLANEFSDG